MVFADNHSFSGSTVRCVPFRLQKYMIPAIISFGIFVLICATDCPASIVQPIKVCMNDEPIRMQKQDTKHKKSNLQDNIKQKR